MPYHIVVELEMIRLTLSGTLSSEDLVAIADEVDEIERGLAIVPHRITVTKEVTKLEIDHRDVKVLADRRRSTRFPNAFKSAIVAGTPAHTGMAQMFRTLNDNPLITIEVFGEERAALEWLRN